MTRIAIVGGGITGLAAAYELRRAADPPAVTIFEADDRLGGKLRTSAFAGLPAVDEGADAFLARVPWGLDLVRDLGLDDLVTPATGRAYVWWDGRLHPIPEGLVLGVPAGLGRLVRSPLLSWGAKARAAVEPLVPRGHPAPDNLGALIERRFGREVLDRLVDPLVGSVNAGDASHLSLAATSPQIAEAAASSRSLLLGLRRRPTPPAGPVFVAPRGGMEALVAGLVGALDNTQVRLGTRVDVVAPLAAGRWSVDGFDADAVLLATPAYEAGRLLRDVSPAAASGLAGIGYASVVMVSLAFPEAAVGRRLDGSGHLVPKPVQRHVTAVSWASTKWAHWKQPGQVILRASLGRWGDEHAVELDDNDVVAAALADLEVHLGLAAAPTAWRVTRWSRSFPQYRPGHLGRIDAIEHALAVDAPGVAVTGAAFRGLGIPACIRQGREWAIATMRRFDR